MEFAYQRYFGVAQIRNLTKMVAARRCINGFQYIENLYFIKSIKKPIKSMHVWMVLHSVIPILVHQTGKFHKID